MANAIEPHSTLYGALIRAYEIDDKRIRFFTCYDLAHNADYKEIHLAISMLKEAHSNNGVENIATDSLQIFLNGLKTVFLNEVNQRNAFLLDILEEARERKRPLLSS